MHVLEHLTKTMPGLEHRTCTHGQEGDSALTGIIWSTQHMRNQAAKFGEMGSLAREAHRAPCRSRVWFTGTRGMQGTLPLLSRAWFTDLRGLRGTLSLLLNSFVCSSFALWQVLCWDNAEGTNDSGWALHLPTDIDNEKHLFADCLRAD